MALILYNWIMIKDALIKTNPYLKNADTRDAALHTTVLSSTAIEGVHITAEQLRKPSRKRTKPTSVHERPKSYGKRR
jgi:hypothetical protein